MLVRQRIHQQAFRERVVAAYRSQCAMCRLRHASLLDAAHIVPDSEEGEPKVSNGLALCKLHHAAFDGFLVSVTPDYGIQVRTSVLEEEAGPILEHGLEGDPRVGHKSNQRFGHAKPTCPSRSWISFRSQTVTLPSELPHAS